MMQIAMPITVRIDKNVSAEITSRKMRYKNSSPHPVMSARFPSPPVIAPAVIAPIASDETATNSAASIGSRSLFSA